MQTHTHTAKIIFLMTIIWDSLALVVNTNTLPVCTFLYWRKYLSHLNILAR